jgi:hypothetical protein
MLFGEIGTPPHLGTLAENGGTIHSVDAVNPVSKEKTEEPVVATTHSWTGLTESTR